MTERACTIKESETPTFDVGSLDLARCGVLEINVPLLEHERNTPSLSLHFNSWPDDVQRRITKERAQWEGRNPARVIRLVSMTLHQGVAVLILHHGAK